MKGLLIVFFCQKKGNKESQSVLTCLEKGLLLKLFSLYGAVDRAL